MEDQELPFPFRCASRASSNNRPRLRHPDLARRSALDGILGKKVRGRIESRANVKTATDLLDIYYGEPD
jgi:hypothetical protein